MDLSQLTAEDIEQLRGLLAGAEGKRQQRNEFDLNNPPKTPYVFQEFPKCVYHAVTGASKVVKDAAELKAHLDNGYQRESLPAIPADDSPQLDAAALAEAEAIDKILRKPRK